MRVCALGDSGFFRLQGIKVLWSLQFLRYLRTLNFKLKVLKYSRNCSLRATLIPNLVKPLNCAHFYLNSKWTYRVNVFCTTVYTAQCLSPGTVIFVKATNSEIFLFIVDLTFEGNVKTSVFKSAYSWAPKIHEDNFNMVWGSNILFPLTIKCLYHNSWVLVCSLLHMQLKVAGFFYFKIVAMPIGFFLKMYSRVRNRRRPWIIWQKQ